MAKGFKETGVVTGIAQGIDAGAKNFLNAFTATRRLNLQKQQLEQLKDYRDKFLATQQQNAFMKNLQNYGKNWGAPAQPTPTDTESLSRMPDPDSMPMPNVRQGVTAPQSVFPDYSGALFLDPALNPTRKAIPDGQP